MSLLRRPAGLPTGAMPPRPRGWRAVVVQVVAPTDDLGRYTGKLVAGVIDPSASGDLELADLGGVASTSNCELWALADIAAGYATLAAGELVIGLAGPLRSSSDVVVVVTEGRLQPSTIACRIEKTGGNAGNAATQCSYVYTARTADWNGSAFTAGGKVLGTNLTPAKPRPAVGEMICQSGSTGWGIGTWSGGTFILLDALEQVQQDACEGGS